MIFALPEKTLLLYKIRLLGLFAAALALVLCYPWQSRVFWAVFFVMVCACVFGFWYFIKRLRSFQLRLDAGVIIARYGVFFETKRIYLLSSIVCFGKVQSPLAKKRRICAILLKSAPKSLFIPELEEENALKVQEAWEKHNERGL